MEASRDRWGLPSFVVNIASRSRCGRHRSIAPVNAWQLTMKGRFIARSGA
jgi:hypothetical protein